MNTKLFDFQTTVDASIEKGRIEVTITAPKAIRSKIWNLVTDDHFNPGVARYNGQTPTSLTLTPYPGCTGSLLVNLAYAAACFAQVDDFTSLLDGICVIERLSPCPQAINFKPDQAIIMKFQAVVGGYLAIKDLRKRVYELSGINYQAIKVWYDEAVEALRRLRFANTAPMSYLDVALANLDRIEHIEAKARAMHEEQASNERRLETDIANFTTAFETSGLTEQVRNSYHQASFNLKMEQERLNAEVDAFTQSWDTLQEALDQIRKVTPPKPPAPKK